ncbi:MAG: anion permease [Candidatus Hydrogenedentes bacterium]|nr:anion permease [Candidatus Hydrogenedentota bacterium]
MELAGLFLVVLFLAYVNGGNDNFKACATVYASKTLSYRSSLALATAAQVSGSVASVFLAGKLLTAFSGKGLVPDAIVADPQFLLAVGIGGAITIALATLVGLPVSTTHALIGGLIGSGFAFAPGQVVWSNLGGSYFTPLLLSPVLAVLTTAILYPLVSRSRKALGVEPSTCVCVAVETGGVLETPEGIQMLHRSVTGLTVRSQTHCDCTVGYNGSMLGVSAQQIVDTLHIGSAFSMGFARGLNDTPKVLGILLAAGYLVGATGTGVLVLVAVAMAIGGLLHSRPLARTMGERITTMNHGQGLLANAVSSSMVIGASVFGVPVSTTHVSTGAIFGIGAWTGTTNWKMVSGIIGAWIITLPLGALIAFGIARAIASV